jgi:hypothetical protein
MKLTILLAIATYIFSVGIKTSGKAGEFWRKTTLKLSNNEIFFTEHLQKGQKLHPLSQNGVLEFPHSVHLTLGENHLEIAIKVHQKNSVARYIEQEGVFSEKQVYKKQISYQNIFPCVGEALFFIQSGDSENIGVICFSFIVEEKTSRIFTIKSMPLLPDDKSQRKLNVLQMFSKTFMEKVVKFKNKEVASYLTLLEVEGKNEILNLQKLLKDNFSEVKIEAMSILKASKAERFKANQAKSELIQNPSEKPKPDDENKNNIKCFFASDCLSFNQLTFNQQDKGMIVLLEEELRAIAVYEKVYLKRK